MSRSTNTHTSEETIRSWVCAAQQGDKRAKELLVDQFRALIAKYARWYVRPGTSIEDLMQDGIIGLLEAVDNWDSNQGNKFITYATYWIRQTVSRGRDRAFHIRIPSSTLNKRVEIQKVIRKFEKEHGRTPTIHELVEGTDFSEEKIQYLLGLQTDTVSADDVIEGTDLRVVDTLASEDAPDEEVLNAEYFESIRQAVDQLSEAHRVVVILRFGLDGNGPRSLGEIASVLHMSQEGIRNRELAALKKLKKVLGYATL